MPDQQSTDPTTSTASLFRVGDDVGARRWPQPLHEGLPPWRGTVLRLNDVRAWAGTIAFPRPAEQISQAEVDAHVLKNLHLLQTVLAVEWNFDASVGRRIYWTPAADLRPYAQDHAEWEVARNRALQDLSEIHLGGGEPDAIDPEARPQERDESMRCAG